LLSLLVTIKGKSPTTQEVVVTSAGQNGVSWARLGVRRELNDPFLTSKGFKTTLRKGLRSGGSV